MVFLAQLIGRVRTACVDFPDARRGDVRHRMADIGLSAFSLFFMQSESFLSYQRSLEEGRKTSNCRTLFGMAAIPTDNHIRAMLDPVHPSHLQPVFDGMLDLLRRRDGLVPFERPGGRVLIALDGTEYFCSQKLGCPQCLTRERSNGEVERYHSMLCATIVAPWDSPALDTAGECMSPKGRDADSRWGGVCASDRELAMSLHPASDSSVPDDTAAVARAVFPQGTACLRLRDRLGPIFADEQFASLFPKSGQPAECPWRLALVTLLQFGENLSDRRAADAPTA